MKATSVHIKNIMELNSSVIIYFEILLWLSGCENFSGHSRNGPLSAKYSHGKDYIGYRVLWEVHMQDLSYASHVFNVFNSTVQQLSPPTSPSALSANPLLLAHIASCVRYFHL